MSQMTVDFDNDKFVVRCPVWANDALTGIPSKRWNKKNMAWYVPLVRKNVEFLEERLQKPGLADFTPAAQKAMKIAGTKLEAIKGRKGDVFPAWYRFKTTPRKHQMEALNKAYPKRVFALFMDRGTGKTKTIIDIACARRMEGKIDALMVVVKLSARRTWAEELEVHSPLPFDVFLPEAGKVKAYERWLNTPHDFKILVVGMESLSQGGMAKLAERFMMLGKAMMVIDEAHDISNHKAIRSEACVRLGLMAEFKAISTGTPISTGPMNLFMEFEFLDPDIIGIGDFYAFRNQYAIMGGYPHPKTGKPMEIVGYQNIDELTRLVAPFVFECRKKDVLAHLPPKIFKRLYVDLPEKVRKLYDHVRKEQEYEYAGRTMTAQNVLEHALRLHQIAGGFATTYDEVQQVNGKVKRIATVHPIVPWKDNPKIQEILDIIAEDPDKSVMIWCAYRAEIEAVCTAIRTKFPKMLVREIHGGVDEAHRAQYRQEFQTRRCTKLVGNTATGGTAQTFTACETMIYYNNTERMIDREQSEDRAHRDGLTHPVLYIDLIAEKTVDITIMKSIEAKVDLAEYVRAHIREVGKLLEGTI